MGVSHGADVGRVEGIGRALTAAADELSQIRDGGASSFRILQDAWHGADVEYFDLQWRGAARSLDGASELVRHLGAELLRQADQQLVASEGDGPLGGVGAATPPGDGRNQPGSDGIVQPDDNDVNDVRWWYPTAIKLLIVLRDREGYFDSHEDPGVGNTRLPDGADPEDPVIQELLTTAEGRATLDWMARNQITMVVDPDVKGGYYSAADNTFYMNSGMWQAQGLIHEAAHARQDVDDVSPVATEVGQEEFVEGMLEMEADAMVAEAYYWRDLVEADPQRAADMPVAQVEYWRIYNSRIDAGATPEEADAFGRFYLKEEVRGRTPSVGDPGDTYEEFYAKAWESAN